MKILITGSEGYLGSVLTGYLADLGHECVGYDIGFFRDCLLYAPDSSKTVLLDARDISEKDLSGVDVVIHLAGISNDPMGVLDASRVYDPSRAYTLKIANLCKNLGVRFVFASSCSIYGVGGEHLLNESSPVHPQTPYSLNKLQIESDLQTISGNGFDPIALRFATVFGLSPRIRFDVVVNMLVGMACTEGRIVLNSDGQSWRPNLHILDLCKAVAFVLEFDNSNRGLQIFNVGSDECNLKVIDIAKIVQRVVPGCDLRFLSQNPELDTDGLIRDRKVKASESDTRTYRVSFKKIEKELAGFRCEWDIERGIAQMVAMLRNISLDSRMFKSRGFYRLQQLEYLHSAGLIDDNLKWTKGINSTGAH